MIGRERFEPRTVGNSGAQREGPLAVREQISDLAAVAGERAENLVRRACLERSFA